MRVVTALTVAGALFAGCWPASAEITNAPPQKTKAAMKVETFAKGLVNPWGMAFLPDGRVLVTERPGRMRLIGKDGRLSPPLKGVPPVFASGQGGLLDVALSPDFASSSLIYFSYSEPRGQGSNGTSVARGKLAAGEEAARLDDVKVIFRQEPATTGGMHFGSRLAFARDGNLFVTLGERFQRDKAQDLGNHYGKVVRIRPDGSVPPDNPFVNKAGARPEIWSYGHRNLQSAAINPATGKLWTVEHGARGGDEINIPQAGKNYGWPVITYGRDYSGAEDRRRNGQGRHGAADLLLGSLDRALRHGVLHRRSHSRNGRATCSSARWPGRPCTASCSTATGSSARSACSATSASASATCAPARTARSGC